MNFQVEHILSIKGKAYILAKCLVPTVRFKLSDTCFLGDFAIENWFDMPKEDDENGIQRTDNFTFILKAENDRLKIKQGDILRLFDSLVKVVDSLYSVSGVVFSVFQCNTGMIDIDTMLSADNGQQWKIVENGLPIGRQSDIKLQTRIKDELLYFYRLAPINHSVKPEVGTMLRVVKDGS